MEFQLGEFYEVLSPRCTAIVSTIDKGGNPNAAPFSFLMPISMDPPLIALGVAPKRHTLANIRETGEFVVNIVPEGILDKMMTTSRSFPKGASEIKEAGLTEKKSKVVKAPSIQECCAWLECKFDCEHVAGDHNIVIGRVVHAECKDAFVIDGEFDVAKARPVMHIRRRRFAVADRVVEAPKV